MLCGATEQCAEEGMLQKGQVAWGSQPTLMDKADDPAPKNKLLFQLIADTSRNASRGSSMRNTTHRTTNEFLSVYCRKLQLRMPEPTYWSSQALISSDIFTNQVDSFKANDLASLNAAHTASTIWLTMNARRSMRKPMPVINSSYWNVRGLFS